jgi:hypothetical protein
MVSFVLSLESHPHIQTFTDDFRDGLLEYTFATPMVGVLRQFDWVEQGPLLDAVAELATYGTTPQLRE